MKIRSLIGSVLASTICQAHPVLAEDNGATMKKLEHLRDITIGQHAIHITVISTGCTSAKDFRVESESGQKIAIYRIHPDFCRRAPRPVTLELPWKPLPTQQSHENLQLINPVAQPPDR